MRTPDELLAKISDELNARILAAVNSLRSASPGLNVQPGFPFTIIRAKTGRRSGEVREAEERPVPVIYEILEDDNGDYINFYLGTPTTENGDYPVRMSVNKNAKTFYFLKVVANVESSCVCLDPGADPGPPPSWVCVDTDVTTSSITVVSRGTIPEQDNPMTDPPCGDPEEGAGWGSFFGSPPGKYTVYLPLLCLDYSSDSPVSYAGGELAEIVSKNPMYPHLRDIALLGGDSARLWWSNGSEYSVVDSIQGGDPGALAIAGIYAQALDPDDSEYVLSSL